MSSKNNYDYVKNRLKLIKTLRGYSSTKVARMLGMTYQSYSRFENAETCSKKIMIIALAKVFNVDERFFVDAEITIRIIGTKTFQIDYL